MVSFAEGSFASSKNALQTHLPSISSFREVRLPQRNSLSLPTSLLLIPSPHPLNFPNTPPLRRAILSPDLPPLRVDLDPLRRSCRERPRSRVERDILRVPSTESETLKSRGSEVEVKVGVVVERVKGRESEVAWMRFVEELETKIKRDQRRKKRGK